MGYSCCRLPSADFPCVALQLQEIAPHCLELAPALSGAPLAWAADMGRSVQRQHGGLPLESASELCEAGSRLLTSAGSLLRCVTKPDVHRLLDPRRLLDAPGQLLRRVLFTNIFVCGPLGGCMTRCSEGCWCLCVLRSVLCSPRRCSSRLQPWQKGLHAMGTHTATPTTE